MENLTSLIEAMVALIGALSWPLVVIFLVYYFGKPLKGIISRMGEFSLKAGPSGLEASAKIQELQEKLPPVDAMTTTGFQVKVSEPEGTGEQSRSDRIGQRHGIEERNREVYLVHG